MITHLAKVRVRYADTDQMGVVHHARILEYFEVARSELIRTFGVSYSNLEKRGLLLPVIEVFAQYKKPAYYDELLLVESRLVEFPKATLKIEYDIFRENEKKPIVSGYSVHTFLNAETKKLIRPPDYFIKALEKRWNQNDLSINENG